MLYLLTVSVLFTGVTFSRYVSRSDGYSDMELSRFVCSYEIGDMSAVTFSNTDYWQDFGGENQSTMNTARSVMFTVRNHTLLPDGGVDRISALDLESTMRLYAPAEFLGNLAVQLVEVTEDGAYRVRTPQYVLGNLIYETEIRAEDGSYGYLTENREERSFARHSDRQIETGRFVDYEARSDGGGAADEILTVNGGFTGTAENHTGRIEAVCETTGSHLTLSAGMAETAYSVGFLRGEGITIGDMTVVEGTATPLYLDCVREIPYYTLDIRIPAMEFAAEAGAQERTFVLFLTVVEEIENPDFGAKWEELPADILQAPGPGEVRSFNGATVVGYHYDRQVPVCDAAGLPTGESTTIRILRTYDSEIGGSILSFSHVAAIASGELSVVHPIADFYTWDGKEYIPAEPAFTEGAAEFQEMYATCSNGGASGYLSLSGLPDDPRYDRYENESDGAGQDYRISDAISKGYPSRLHILFVQASESGKEQGGS